MKILNLHRLILSLFLLLLVGCPVEKDNPSGKKDNRTKVDYLWLFYTDADNNLDTALLSNLFQIENCLNMRQSDYSLEIVVLWDGYNPNNENVIYPETKLLKLHASTVDESNDDNRKAFSKNTEDITDTVNWIPKVGNIYEADMGDYHTLQNFLSWAKSTYNAKKTLVTITDHGLGPRSYTFEDSENTSRAYCEDDTNGKIIGTNELAIAFRDADFQTDILEFDCCLAGNFDEVYEMRKYADYIIASPTSKIMNCPGHSYTLTKFLNGETIEDTAVAHANMNAVDIVELNKNTLNQAGTCPLTDKWYDLMPTATDKGNLIEYAEYSSCPYYTSTVSVYKTAECENVYNKFNKIINHFYNEKQTRVYYDSSDDCIKSKTPKRPDFSYSLDMSQLKMYDDKTLMIHYLYATDMSFLVNRGIRGRNGNYPYLDDKWTSISYEGTYQSLYDLGYLMNMYMYTYKKEQEAHITDGITDEFYQMCQDLSDALTKMIVFSWRRLATAVELDGTDYENVTIAGETFQRTKGLYPKYLENLGMSENNLGLTIPCSFSNIDPFYIMPAFKKDSDNDAIYVPYIGLTPDNSYRYASTFSKTTKWSDVIMWLYTADKRFMSDINNTAVEFDPFE